MSTKTTFVFLKKNWQEVISYHSCWFCPYQYCWVFFTVVWFRKSLIPCTVEERLQTFLRCVPFWKVLSRFGWILFLVNFLFYTWQSLAAKLKSCHRVWSILARLTLGFCHPHHSEGWKLRVGCKGSVESDSIPVAGYQVAEQIGDNWCRSQNWENQADGSCKGHFKCHR